HKKSGPKHFVESFYKYDLFGLSFAVSPCPTTICPENHFSFFIQSGAANVVPPKICFRNELVLGVAKKNAGVGINVAVLNGKTGELLKSGHYDMWAGDVKPLIDFLKVIEKGSIVLMASFDEPATKLNEEARKLILDMGSSMIKTVGFRDNWIFVGGKGANVQSTFEKQLKNDQGKNKYDGWPELIDISGCIPKYIA
uniref:ILEI/PANDER domain-containing protein n=1 Tax=Neogobius melanostomus TaxID=47308 RepID=A0A8C6TD53_9GOBI